MSLKDKVKFDILIDPDDINTIIFSPINEPIKTDSVYSFNLKDIQFTDGTSFTGKEDFITIPTKYYYVHVSDVLELVHGLNLDEANIVRHIIDAGKAAVYWANKKSTTGPISFDINTIQDEYFPFYMYIKNHAVVESLKEFYIEAMTNPVKWRDVLSDLEREEEMDFDGIKALIDDYVAEEEEWLDYVVTITADPQWALRGKYCYTTWYSQSNPYHRIHWGQRPHNTDYNRGY